jgi:hypothetical protein
MPALINDEMLAAFAVQASAEQVAEVLTARYRGLVDRLSVYIPFVPGERDAFWKRLVDGG